MIKRILVPLDHSDYSKKALELACKVALANDAEVTGIVILDIPGITGSIGPIPIGATHFAKKLERAKIDSAHKRIDDLLLFFNDFCDKNAVKHRHHESQGIPSNKILINSMFYDLLIIGLKTYYSQISDDKPGDSFELILEQAITPVIAIPKDYKLLNPDTSIKTLIAFDGSIESCRALQRFVNFIEHRSNDINVRLLMSHDDQDSAMYFLEKAERYLRAHNIHNIELIHTEEHIITAIDKEHIHWATTFVLGAHMKRGLFDFMVGSLTRYLIKETKVPLFIGM